MNRRVELGLGLLTIIVLLLIAFTDLIITNGTRYYQALLLAHRGVLYFPLLVMTLFVIGYFYSQIILTKKKSIRPADYVPNTLPVILGIGIGLLCGLLDVIGVMRGKPTIPGASWPFTMLGVFFISVGYAWTFLSRHTRFIFALDESHLEHDKLVEKYNRSFVEFVKLIAETLDAKDHYTAGHALRVRDYALEIAGVLNLSKSEIALLEQAALLHDIGKISIPDGILNKKAPLTDKERAHIWQHPVVAKKILSTVSDFQDILDIIYNHHERVDGKGYPEGKAKEKIPVLSRIIAVADTYDAMRSERPYRNAKSKTEAIEELLRVKGTQLDEEIVEKFVAILA